MVVGNFGRIILNLDGFGVPGAIAANVFVGRVLEPTAGVTNAAGSHAINLAEGRFHSPETSRCKCSFGHGSLSD
jgi:hypothetical protein